MVQKSAVEEMREGSHDPRRCDTSGRSRKQDTGGHVKVRGGRRKSREEQRETTNESTGNRNQHGKRQKINFQTRTNTANKAETTAINRQNE